MRILENFTSDPKQRHQLVIPGGETISLQIEYKPQQSGWFFTEITHNDVTIKNLRICTSPNLLHQYVNQLPFGLMVTTTDAGEPTQQQDFLSRRSVMYLLDADECAAYRDYLNNG